ncbi:MAG: hypothetical protein Q3X99_03755, partial [Faecalibacterium sp.]|nr:hypothetical protein [Faecalibacterium sp.]
AMGIFNGNRNFDLLLRNACGRFCATFLREGVVKADGSCDTPNIYHHGICNPAADWFVYKADRHPAAVGTE